MAPGNEVKKAERVSVSAGEFRTRKKCVGMRNEELNDNDCVRLIRVAVW
jgi:hypothetical protein